jgi:hypothetical protein
VIPCSVVDRFQCFRRTCCLHSNGSRASSYEQWQYRYRDWNCEQSSGRQKLFEKPTVFVKRKGLYKPFEEERGDEIIGGGSVKRRIMNGAWFKNEYQDVRQKTQVFWNVTLCLWVSSQALQEGRLTMNMRAEQTITTRELLTQWHTVTFQETRVVSKSAVRTSR